MLFDNVTQKMKVKRPFGLKAIILSVVTVVREAILKFNFNSNSDNIEHSREVGDLKIATIVRTKTQPHPEPHPPSETKPNISVRLVKKPQKVNQI